MSPGGSVRTRTAGKRDGKHGNTVGTWAGSCEPDGGRAAVPHRPRGLRGGRVPPFSVAAAPPAFPLYFSPQNLPPSQPSRSRSLRPCVSRCTRGHTRSHAVTHAHAPTRLSHTPTATRASRPALTSAESAAPARASP